MLSKKQDVVCARAWMGLAAGVVLLTACPGYLEEQAFRFSDAGVISVAVPEAGPVLPPPLPAGTGGNTGSAAPAGTGGTPAAAQAAASLAPAPDAAAPAPPAAMAPAAAQPRACATAAEIVGKILMPKCAKCHKAEMPAAGLDLATAGAKARLLGVAARCAGKTLAVVDPAVGGHLFDKLAGPVMGCGMRMPLNGAALSADEVDCLKEWLKPPAAPAAPAPPAAPVSCSSPQEISTKILVPRCGNCHGVMMPAAGLDLVSPGSKARLVGIPSRACAGRVFITAEGDVTGHFFDKLAGAIPGCGNQMPFGGINPLNQAEIQCLKDWIRPTP
jgi:hypothetical protein